MKKRLKQLTAVFVALAFVLTATPPSGFAADEETTLNNETEVTTEAVTEPETEKETESETKPETETETESATEYKITYYSNGKKYGDEQTYKAGETIVPPEAPEAPEGHIFNGWVINEKQDKLPETMPEANLEASASWKLKDITLTFVSDEAEIHKETAPYGSSMADTVPEDPSKEGYTFAGWYDENGKNAFDHATVPAEDITFTAKWLKNGNVVYMMSKDKTYASYEVKEGDKIPVPETAPKKFAHKFVGWSPEIPAEMPAEDLVFEAQYEVDKDFVTVVIGGTLIAGGIVAGVGAAITGLSIVGGIIAVIGLSSVIGNVNKTYTVTYRVDGDIYKTYNIAAGSQITLPAEPEKEGYDFVGWTPDVPDKMPKKNLSFDAVWSKGETDIPETGSSAAGITAFAALAVSAAAAIIFIQKKKDK